MKTGENILVEGETFVNNNPVDPYNAEYRKTIAFVGQDEVLHSTSTPREAIKFSARLRLPRWATAGEIDQLVARTVQELGLSACADTVISKTNASEKKRTCIGMELISKPSCMFLDEPTFGMDTLEAMQVCSVLNKAASAGTTVLFSLQQPDSEIVRSGFDHMILLHKGKVAFHGPVEDAPNFFAARGFACPSNYNLGDWMLQVAQTYPIGVLSQQGFYAKDEKFAIEYTKTTSLVEDEGTKLMSTITGRSRSSRPPGLATQVQMLLERELISRRRTLWWILARLGVTLLGSVLIGTIFFQVGETNSSDVFNLQSQFGGLIILLTFAMLRTAVSTIVQCSMERYIFQRESDSDYSTLAYFITRICIEAADTWLHTCIMVVTIFFLVGFRGSLQMFLAITYALSMASGAITSFVGALTCGNETVSLLVTLMVFLPQLVFTGIFVVSDLIPIFYSWVQWMCVLSPASKLLLVEEFYGCSEASVESPDPCQTLLERVQADPDESIQNWVTIVAYFAIFRIAAIFMMKL